jgi:hypothetical protein
MCELKGDVEGVANEGEEVGYPSCW